MRVTDFIISLDSCLSPEHCFICRHKTGNQFTTHSIYSFSEFLLTTFAVMPLMSLQTFTRKSRIFLVPLQCDIWRIWLGRTHWLDLGNGEGEIRQHSIQWWFWLFASCPQTGHIAKFHISELQTTRRSSTRWAVICGMLRLVRRGPRYIRIVSRLAD